MPREIITVPVQRVQEPELQQDEEQEDHDGAAGDEKVLPVLPQASTAPGDEVSAQVADYRSAR